MASGRLDEVNMATGSPYHILIHTFRRPQGCLIGAFAGLILLGMLLLSLPVAHTHAEVSVLDALFTATSAVCVTGLVVCDTGQDFSRFGQIVILVLIQMGGLGIMTFAALAMQMAGRKLSYRSEIALHDMFYQNNAAAQLRRNLKWIVLLTLGFEGLGTILLVKSMPDSFEKADAIYIAIFHAISAFCNAGFSTFSDSLIGMRQHVAFMTVISILIILGGLGYTVILEIISRSANKLFRHRTPICWSLNTRLVLTTSVALILIGAIIFDTLGLAAADIDWQARAGDAVFQSITARTAGFNTVDLGHLPTPSLLWLVLLMFVGGSPGSCAGGIKTTSLAVWIARLKARLLLREDVTIAGRRIPVDLVRRTGLLLGVATVYNLVGVMVLSITEMGDTEWRLEDILFEQVSAFATVGLATGLTATLSATGKLWIILTMFVGRVGPLTIAMAVMDSHTTIVRMSEERIMIG